MKQRLLINLVFLSFFCSTAAFAEANLLKSTLSKCKDGYASQTERFNELLALGWTQATGRQARTLHDTLVASYVGISTKYGNDSVRAARRDADDVFTFRYLENQPRLTGRKPYQEINIGTYLWHDSSNSVAAIWMVRPSDGTAGSAKKQRRFSCIIATTDVSFANWLIARAKKNPWDPKYLSQSGDEVYRGELYRRKFELRDHTNINFPRRLAAKSPKRFLVISDVTAEPAR